MAHLARKAPHVEPGSVDGLSQGAHRREVHALRGLRSRSALLRLDRQSCEATRRRSLCDQGDAAQTCQQMVGHQSRRCSVPSSAGLLKPAGLVAAPTANKYAAKPKIPELPGYIAKAIKADRKAWSFLQKLPRTERRNFVVWIHIAKRPETRARRIRESIALLAAGKNLGLK